MIGELSTRVNRELDHLVAELTERIPLRSAQEQDHASHARTVERQTLVQRRINYLRRISSGLSTVEPAALSRGGIGFGSTVRVQDLRTGQTLEYTLMTGDDLDLDGGEISLGSPVGQALLGCHPGDEVEVATPQGRRRLRILWAATLFDRLEADAAPMIEAV